MASSEATAGGSDGASGTTIRPSGVSDGSSSAATSAARIAVVREPDDRRGLEGLTGPGDPLASRAAVGQDQDEPGAGVRRWQVAVQERLEVARRGGDPGALLELQHELPGGGPIRPGGDDEDRSTPREPGGDGLGGRGGLGADARRHQRPDRAAIGGVRPSR